ncbi:hypothetical protein Zmor_005808 [Zophobas morio]|uniref:Transposable element Tc3 transposase n=1 Tax=Zophobas morio TaxID=2755281 RepID=A0AA38ITU5_9CUCU|nr:hypothetical protein Zmor_005808 [Zophobas morio]
MGYTLEQNTFIVMSYYRNGTLNADGEWVYSVQACKDEYLAKFPELNIEEQSLMTHIKRIVDRFNSTGNVSQGKSPGRPPVSEEVVEDLRERMEQSPKKSLSKLSLQSGVPYTTCQKVLKRTLHMHPYKVSSIHELKPADYPRRVAYCEWFQNNMNNRILDLSFFSDEAWFHLNGYVNSQNYRVWSAENPFVFEERPLHSVKVGVWLAVSRRRVIGPIFFHNTINSARYREQILEVFLNHLDDEELEFGYFQQDGAPAHKTMENLRYLQEFYGDRIISQNLNPEWPARSPDLTPLDYSIFGWMKDNIYKHRLHTLEELMDAIIHCCQNIDVVMLENIFENKKRRVALCLQQNGEHFQHLL